MNESVADYMAELRHLATTCQFNEYLEQALRDRLVCGLCHEPTQKKLLTESRLTLVKAIEIAQSMEAAEKNSQQITEPQQDVMKVTEKGQRAIKKEQPRFMCYRCGGTNHAARDANTEIVSVISVRKKATWLKFAAQEEHKRREQKPNPLNG